MVEKVILEQVLLNDRKLEIKKTYHTGYEGNWCEVLIRDVISRKSAVFHVSNGDYLLVKDKLTDFKSLEVEPFFQGEMFLPYLETFGKRTFIGRQK